MRIENKKMFYKVYELPGHIVCGNCGMLMRAHADHAIYKVGQTFADYECYNELCSDKKIPVRIDFKQHEIEIRRGEQG